MHTPKTRTRTGPNAAAIAAATILSLSAAASDATTWTDPWAADGAIWWEQPLEADCGEALFSTRGSNILTDERVDDLEFTRDVEIDEIVFYGYAYHEWQDRWALNTENITAFRVEFLETVGTFGCSLDTGAVIAWVRHDLDAIDVKFTGVTSADGSPVQRYAMKLNSPLSFRGSVRYAIRIVALVEDPGVAVGFKWATTDLGHLGTSYDTTHNDCGDWWITHHNNLDHAFELAGPTPNGTLHTQLADHDTALAPTTVNSPDHPVRRYDDFTVAEGSRADAVSFYASICDPLGDGSSTPLGALQSIQVSLHHTASQVGGPWLLHDTIATRTVDVDHIEYAEVFRQQTPAGQRRFYRFTVDMPRFTALEGGRRYAVGIAGRSRFIGQNDVLVWGQTFESSLQQTGSDAIVVDNNTGQTTSAGFDHAFTIHGSKWCGLADIANQLGVLDLSDTLGFIAAFQAVDEAADLDENGIIDLADISLFITAFLEGCD